MENTLSITLQSNRIKTFFPLFQQGVIIKTLIGGTIKDLLSHRLGISPEYVENRIQTIFLDGKAVDDLEAASIRDGSVLALSAAMPGLVGATLRRGGAFASLRQAITFSSQNQSIPKKEGQVTVKLFNLLVSELGPQLLADGVWIKGENLNSFFRGLKNDFWKDCRISQERSREIAGPHNPEINRFEKEDLILLRVSEGL